MRSQMYANPSVLPHDFSKLPHADIPRSTFSRSHCHKTSCETDYLYPIYVDEVLPGDTFAIDLSMVCRLMPTIKPIMDNLEVDVFYFFVPNRLLWTNWKRFMGERDPDPDSSIDFTVPQVTAPVAGYAEESLFDYMGIPTDCPGIEVNALHSRAYNLIWNSWFRSQDLQDSVTVDTGNGPDTDTDYVLLKRGKRHDYFTSCLPDPQKGDSVELPLGSWAEVLTRTTDRTFGTAEEPFRMWDPADGTYTASNRSLGLHQNDGEVSGAGAASHTVSEDAVPSNLWANLATATASDINSLREAFQLQKMLERDQRSGTRYPEVLMSHFGVTDPQHAVLQRPEYLGGGTRPVIVEPVARVVESLSKGTGRLVGVGAAVGSGIGFTKSFTEHGVLMGLVNFRVGDITYQQGMNRMWSRQSREDYYFPALAHLGEQEVLLQELYCQDESVDTDTDGTSDNKEVFGYQERWAEYRTLTSRTSSYQRSTHSTALDYWHLGLEFDAVPVLNSSFIEEQVPMERVLQYSEGTPAFICDFYFKISATRPMPVWSIPGLIDHF